jgi:hypothetical protein
MLAFISFWRASAVVLCDLASTAYYIGGIVEQAIGKAAPWYIGAVMLFAYAVRGVYIESCAMFVRGGVYRVVKEAMGGTLAKLSVSALMFDYVLTGPISGVSAGQYIVGLANELLHLLHVSATVPTAAGSALIAIGITLYFWHQNILGIEESSDKAMKIMGVTTVMIVVMIVWCGLTIWQRGATLPPFELHAAAATRQTISEEARKGRRSSIFSRGSVVLRQVDGRGRAARRVARGAAAVGDGAHHVDLRRGVARARVEARGELPGAEPEEADRVGVHGGAAASVGFRDADLGAGHAVAVAVRQATCRRPRRRVTAAGMAAEAVPGDARIVRGVLPLGRGARRERRLATEDVPWRRRGRRRASVGPRAASEQVVAPDPRVEGRGGSGVPRRRAARRHDRRSHRLQLERGELRLVLCGVLLGRGGELREVRERTE